MPKPHLIWFKLAIWLLEFRWYVFVRTKINKCCRVERIMGHDGGGGGSGGSGGSGGGGVDGGDGEGSVVSKISLSNFRT